MPTCQPAQGSEPDGPWFPPRHRVHSSLVSGNPFLEVVPLGCHGDACATSVPSTVWV